MSQNCEWDKIYSSLYPTQQINHMGCDTIYSFTHRLSIGCISKCHQMSSEIGVLCAGFSYEKDGPNEDINIIGQCHLCLLMCPIIPGHKLYLTSQHISMLEVDMSEEVMKGRFLYSIIGVVYICVYILALL